MKCLVENNFCLTDCRNHANHKQKSASMLHFRIPQKTANAKHSYDRYICTARMSKCKTFSGLIITRKYDDNLNLIPYFYLMSSILWRKSLENVQILFNRFGFTETRMAKIFLCWFWFPFFFFLFWGFLHCDFFCIFSSIFCFPFLVF